MPLGVHKLNRSTGEKPRCARRFRTRSRLLDDTECVDTVLATRMFLRCTRFQRLSAQGVAQCSEKIRDDNVPL